LDDLAAGRDVVGATGLIFDEDGRAVARRLHVERAIDVDGGLLDRGRRTGGGRAIAAGVAIAVVHVVTVTAGDEQRERSHEGQRVRGA